ncbi:aquaporin [Streptomyces formicae]|uniref:aquaporin n=1 Tax=Streptomyces formicae TaxID=1616117 RepID=UPI001F58C915|nr:aquaporin [Streptomyces formicae]
MLTGAPWAAQGGTGIPGCGGRRDDEGATFFIVGVLIALLGPVSGAHFNAAVSLADWWTARPRRRRAFLLEAVVNLPVQITGAIAGVVLADAMLDGSLVE